MTNKEFFISRLEYELPVFLNSIRAVPDKQDSYTPHPKTRTAKQIVEHFIAHPKDLKEAADTGCVNHRFFLETSSMNEAAKFFENDCNALIESLKMTSDADWENKVIKFIVMENEFPDMNMPLNSICWRMLFDMVHHRGQLSTYYRLMGTVNPSIYGPTSEMMEQIMASMQN
jgi:hypothetical protein